jgi:uncharacterized protein YhfF
MSTAIDEFVAAARSVNPDANIGRVKVRTFGSSAAMANVIVPLILTGQKTGTFALASDFEADPAAAPQVGDDYVVTWFEGPPALLYRVTEVQIVPFEGIDHDHVQVEGPNARNVDTWRRIHWEYWGSLLRGKGREPSMTMPVIFHRFEVLYPRIAMG